MGKILVAAFVALVLGWLLWPADAQVTTGPNRGGGGSVSSTTSTLAFTNALTLYVRTNGNDTTARIGRIDLPWASLTNAFSNTVNGAVIDVGAGTFNCGISNQLRMPTNGVLRGAGPGATLIVASNWNNGAVYTPVFLKISDNCSIQDLTITTPYEANMYVTPIGTDITSGIATNASVHNVRIFGNSDGLMLSCANYGELNAYNTDIYHAYDGINMQNNVSSVIRLYGCRISEYADTARANWAGGGVGEGIGIQSGRVEMYGGSIWATNRLGVNLNDATTAFCYLEGVTITTTNTHILSVITSGTSPNMIAKNTVSGTAEPLRVAGKVWLDNANAVNTVDTPIFGMNVTNSGVSSLKRRAIYGWNTNRIEISETNMLIKSPSVGITNPVGGLAVGATAASLTNVFEVVNQDGLKVLEVGTNSYTYMGSNLVVKAGPLVLGSILETSTRSITGGGTGSAGWDILNNHAGYTMIFERSDSQPLFATVSTDFWVPRLSFGSDFASLDGSIARSAAGSLLVSTNLIARGTLTATNGVASYASSATNAIAATGITNTSTIWRQAMVVATATAFQVKNSAGTVVNNVPVSTQVHWITLQPGGAVTAASGLAGTLTDQ